MGKPRIIISIIVIAGFGGTLMEIIRFLLNAHTSYIMHGVVGLFVGAFLVAAFRELNRRTNVIRPHQRRQRRYPWFEPPR